MSIDRVLYLVGKGFEVAHDPNLAEGVITAKMNDIEFKVGDAMLTIEIEVWFHEKGTSSVFFLLHNRNMEMLNDNDYYDHWVTGKEIKQYAKERFADFKANIAKINIIF